jgi:hypothetical protein
MCPIVSVERIRVSKSTYVKAAHLTQIKTLLYRFNDPELGYRNKYLCLRGILEVRGAVDYVGACFDLRGYAHGIWLCGTLVSIVESNVRTSPGMTANHTTLCN